MLRMRTHTPSRQEEDEARHEISLGATITASREPDARQPCGPPDNAHNSVLDVVLDPRAAPAVLGEGIDATPCRDNGTVEELLTTARAA